MALHCVASSDWHLEGMKKVLTDPLPYQIREINKVYEYALTNSIEHFFVPGDLCHTPSMTDQTLIALIALLLTHDGSIHTYYTLGNHDVSSIKASSLDVLASIADAGLFKTFHLYKQPTVATIENVQVAFMPFPHNVVPTTSRPPLVLAHIETAGALGDNGRPLKSGHESDFIRQPGDYIISGHLHQHQFLKKKRVLYVGSLYQTNFGESLPKGFLDVTAKYVKGNLVVNYKHINSHPDFVLETKVISSDQDWKDLDDCNSVRYKLLVEEGIVVPKLLTAKLTNIISIAGLEGNTKVSMEDVANDTIRATSHSLPVFKITTGLKHYAKQAGLDPKQLRRAQSLAKDAAGQLGLYR